MSEPANVFIDAAGRKLPVTINTDTLRRLRTEIKFTFDEALSANVKEKDAEKELDKYNAFLNDDLRFAEVLYTILKPQLEKEQITQQQFEQGLDGEANVRAINAFHAAFEGFSRDPRKSFLRGIKMSREKQQKATAIGMKRLESESAKLDDSKLEKLVNEKIDQALKDNASSGAAN
jgi:hypothetical protein